MKISDLIEATFSRKKSEKGTVPFRKSVRTDPHILAVISDISKRTGVPESDIAFEIQREEEKFEEIGKYSPYLYDILLQNAAENAAFKHIGDSTRTNKLDINDIKFSGKIFRNLIKIMIEEMPWLQHITRAGEIRPVYGLPTIIVPSTLSKYKKYNNVKTAAATPSGDFIFNEDFMQQLLYYGTVIDLQPTGKKYECNGGVIPSAYAYIEFLIMHEVFHYIQNDFSKMARYKKFKHKHHNFATDFQNNYTLVKNGFTQLPTGLFSDDLNMDRLEFPKYKFLLMKVREEMEKLPAHLKEWMEIEVAHDEHEGKDTPEESDDSETDDTEAPEPTFTPGQIVVQKGPGYPKRIKLVRVVMQNGKETTIEDLTPSETEEIMNKLRKLGKIK